MSNSGVYLIENTTKQKYYVGSSTNIDNRLKNHFSTLRNNKHIIKEMQDDFNNGDCFTSRTLKELPNGVKNLLLYEENKSIKEYSQKGKMYNKGFISDNPFTKRRTLELLVLDMFFKEHFGLTYAQTLSDNAVPAKIEMYYNMIQHPDQIWEIRDRYYPAMYYQYKQYYDRTHHYNTKEETK